MLKPSPNDIFIDNQSRYSFVIAIAKRAREIAEEAQRNHEILTEKPVSLAVGEFARGEYEIKPADSGAPDEGGAPADGAEPEAQD